MMKCFTPLITNMARCVTLLALLLTLTARAELIEADAFDDGDNKAFTLDLTGYDLIWLDVSEVKNLDIDDIQVLLEGSLQAQGWRIATFNEANQLLDFLFIQSLVPESVSYPEAVPQCIPELFCTFIEYGGVNSETWAGHHAIVGLDALTDETFAHTFYVSTRKNTYHDFNLTYKSLIPAASLEGYPELSHPDVYLNGYNSTLPMFMDADYIPTLDPNAQPFSFLLVKGPQQIPEPGSILLLVLGLLVVKIGGRRR
ncbi:PEP-CTERM sorting domain-containing protein [Thalassotalea litorea]|uniref:PEP-CTERM sorting domain-containing protein n=1 Tax=Thalassotalea litorea TaxID=2020715 RepID=A0A5R9IHT0_9GAMM|nr:PEP-CTERM sorting domain-containing protein [Thalassotalea litorea]TLU65084.1 PEP-CTERM sorting domain-containing protein [Thalassotalea litorea]